MENIVQINIPKKVAIISICGAFKVYISEDNTDFIFPTEEQKKNLKETLCIDVEDLRNEGLNE